MIKILKIRYILALALCFFCITSFGFSQETENCKGPCFEEPWIAGSFSIYRQCGVLDPPPCRIDYYYQYKECDCIVNGVPQVCREFRINEIKIPISYLMRYGDGYVEINNDFQCSCFRLDVGENDTWGNEDIEDIIYECQLDFLYESIGLFGMWDPQYQSFWLTNRTKACWSFWNTGLVVDFSPCNYSDCCVTEYHIVKAKKGCPGIEATNHVSYSANYPSAFDCDIEGGQQCENICGTYVLAFTQIFPKEATNEDSNQEIKSHNPIKIIPNPIQNKVDFYISDENLNGDANLNIYNNLGELIESQAFKKTETDKVLSIDFQKQVNGIYLYQIIFKNNMIFNGKFIKK